MVIDETRWVIGIDHAKPNSDRTVCVADLSYYWADGSPVLFNCASQLKILEHIYTRSAIDPSQPRPQTKAEKNKARLKQLRGRAGRWA